MFYSQTFLARKGPLSTVWIAAHLQHRLKKSHYTSTDIPSTVDRIMDPEVPIALRMSGHLLLGVVRIYSKKVDYLFNDCNAALIGLNKAFASMQLNLPEDARQAPVQFITLPETFDLDALNLDYEIHHNGVEDIHVRNEDEITLTDRNHVGMDHHVAITFDEDIVMNSSHTDVLPNSGARSMEDEYIIIPQSPLANVGGIQDGGPSIQRESPVTQHVDGDPSHNFQDNSPPLVTQVMPIEVLRHHNNASNTENSPLIPDFGDNNTEPNKDLDQTLSGKDHIPEIVDDLDLNGVSAPSQAQHHFGPPTPVTSQGAASEPQVCGGPSSLNLMLRASPPIQQPQRRGRKRKPFFDEPIVLSNSFIRKSLNDTRDILRKRKEVPSSTLDTFKLNNSRRKEHIFEQPLLTGLCKDLLDISRREYICSRPNLVINEEDNMDAEIAGIPPSTNQIPEERRAATPPPVTASDLEIEHLRNSILAPHPTIPACNVDMEFNIEDDRRSPVRNDDLTPVSAKKLRSVSVSPLGTNIASETMQTSDFAASTLVFQMETPMTNLDDTFQNYGLSDTHQLINSAETEELGFLEMENNTPASSQGTSKNINKLSARTRAAAQYLKRHSPITPILEDPVGDLSLNKILEGKTRKHSARMFFEVLALKTHGLVDVQQEEPYGDVSLKLTPTLSNARF